MGKGPSPAECSAEPGWLKLETATSCHQTPFREEALQSGSFLHSPHFIASAYTTYSSTKSPELTTTELTRFGTEEMQQHPAHGFY